jgi:hypothetical protein
MTGIRVLAKDVSAPGAKLATITGRAFTLIGRLRSMGRDFRYSTQLSAEVA